MDITNKLNQNSIVPVPAYNEVDSRLNRVKMVLRLLGVSILLTLFAHPVAAAPGSIDTSFGSGGKVITNFGANDQALSVAVQTDGKIVVAGCSYTSSVSGTNFTFKNDMALARYDSNGRLDTGFGTGGKVTLTVGAFVYAGFSTVVLEDGRILVSGAGAPPDGKTVHFVLICFKDNGMLDTGFGDNGKVITSIGTGYDGPFGIVVQKNDGKIVVAGISEGQSGNDFALVRYDSKGKLDTSFGTGGMVTTDFGGNDVCLSVSVQKSDGKILAAGWSDNGITNDFALARYNTDGTPDSSFGAAGKVTTLFASGTDSFSGVAWQNDGKILVAGVSKSSGKNKFAVARYNVDGKLDSDFGDGGNVYTDVGSYGAWATSVRVQSNGKILVAGSAVRDMATGIDFALARYNANGTLDTTFNGTGKVTAAIGSGRSTDSVWDLAVQADGKIVLAGNTEKIGGDSDFALARYQGDALVVPPLISIHASGEVLTSGSNTLDFGKVTVGKKASLIFTIKNNGAGPLDNLDATITNSNGIQFTSVGKSLPNLAPGQSTTFVPTYVPTASGTHAAVLHITSNDPATPSFDINLVGEGVSFAPQAGTFSGLLNDGTGFITLTVDNKGKFTGKLVCGGTSYTLNNGFDANGDFTGTVGKPPLLLALRIDLSSTSATAGDYVMSGSAGGRLLSARHAAYNKGQTVLEEGKYTSLLGGTDSSASVPQGTGYATLTVSKTGGVIMAGKLADNTAFSSSGLLVGGTGGNQFIVFDPTLYSQKGLLAGIVTFKVLANSDCDGALQWFKPQQKSGSYYKAGFDTNLTVAGSLYTKLPNGQAALPMTTGRFALSGGGLNTPILEPVMLLANNALSVTGSNTEHLKLTINAATGSLSGSFTHPVTKKAVSFGGLLFQNPNTPRAGGFFLGPVISGTGYGGELSLTPN